MANDGWAYLPEDGRPDRLIRYTKLIGGQLAAYDENKNILRVDRAYYESLDALDQGRVLSTHRDLFVANHGGRISIAHS